jgi:ParB-like chromosome segregation protein Spo0J
MTKQAKAGAAKAHAAQSSGEAAAVWVPIEDLLPWAKNPRKNQPIADVAESIKKFGFAAPIIARAPTARRPR